MSDGLEGLLADLSADEYWRRARALERLGSDPPSPDVLARLAEALGDEASADRRNAARSAFAALAAPGAQRSELALAKLIDLLSGTEDADVRLLAAAALGESANVEAREALQLALRDPDPNVAAAAAEALGQLRDPRAVEALERALGKDSFWVRAAAVAALGQIGGVPAVEALRTIIDDRDLAPMIASGLGSVGDPGAMEVLGSVLERHPSAADAVLAAAAELLGANPQQDVPAWLRDATAAREARLTERLEATGDPAVARLLGAAGTPGAAELLATALCTAERKDAAYAGVALLPEAVVVPVILARLRDADPGERLALINALPPLGEEATVRQIADHLADPAEEVRLAAAEALGRSVPDLVLPTLNEAVRQPETRLAAAHAFARLRDPRCQPLEPLLSDAHPLVRAAAADGLARCGSKYFEPLRLALHRESDPAARVALIRALGTTGESSAARELAALAADEDPGIRFAVVEALGRSGAPEAYLPLLERLTDERPEIQAAALQALGELGDPRAAEPLGERLEHGNRDLRRTAAFALDRLTPPGAVNHLIGALQDTDREVRLTAIRLLARVGGSSALPRLEAVADRDPEPLVRRAACDAADLLRTRVQEAH